MTIFEQAKQQLDIISVAKSYGINVKNGKNALCPFHNDKHPSMSFKGEICTCFTCNITFDVISLTGRLFDLTPIEAVKKLNDDFMLQLDIGKPIARTKIKQIENDNALLDKFNKWENWACDVLCRYFRQLHFDKTDYAPKTPNDEIHPYFVIACHNFDYIEYLSNILIYSEFTDKLSLYKTHRKEIESIANKIRENRVVKST